MNSDGCSVTHFTQSVIHNTIHHHHSTGGGQQRKTAEASVATPTLTQECMSRARVVIQPIYFKCLDPDTIRANRSKGPTMPLYNLYGEFNYPFCCGKVFLTLAGGKDFEIGRIWTEEPPLSKPESSLHLTIHDKGVAEIVVCSGVVPMRGPQMACMCNLLVKLKTTLWLAILLAVGNLRDYIIKHYRNPPPPSLIPIRVRRPPIINLSAPFPMNLVNPIPMAGSGLSIRTGQQQSAQKKKYVTRYKPKPSNQVVVHSTRPRWSTAGPSSSMNSLSLSRSRTTLSSNKQLAELKEVVKKQATQLETQIALLKIQGETMKTQSEALKLQSETLKTQSEMLESLLDERPG